MKTFWYVLTAFVIVSCLVIGVYTFIINDTTQGLGWMVLGGVLWLVLDPLFRKIPKARGAPFHDALWKRRNEINLSLFRLAERSKITVNRLDDIENGKINPKLSEVADILKVLYHNEDVSSEFIKEFNAALRNQFNQGQGILMMMGRGYGLSTKTKEKTPLSERIGTSPSKPKEDQAKSKILGEFVRSKRVAMGLTQVALGRKAAVNSWIISAGERGDIEFGDMALRNMSKLFELSFKDLCGLRTMDKKKNEGK